MPKCKICNEDKAYVSQHGKCLECAWKLMIENIRQQRAKKGEHYEKWRRNIMRAIQEGRPLTKEEKEE